VETVCRNVKRWRAGDHIERWVGSGLLVAERQFRKVQGYREIPEIKEVAGVTNANMPPSAATILASTKPSGPFKLTVRALMLAMPTGLEKRMEIRTSTGTSMAASCGEEALTSAAPGSSRSAL
jgi:hypothetical protein